MTSEAVSVWWDEAKGGLMSDLGPVDSTCFADVRSGHCPHRHQCVILDRAPGPRLLYASDFMSDLDDEAAAYLETHAKLIDADLISISVDHVSVNGPAGSWRYRLLPMRWKTADGGRNDGAVNTGARLAVWPD
jgi:hypothetical protein